jgi:hypothetical protein
MKSKRIKNQTEAAVMMKQGQPVAVSQRRLDKIPQHPLLQYQNQIGNQAVIRLLTSRNSSLIQPQRNPSCTVDWIEKTRKVKDAPPTYYGAEFNHKFASELDACKSLKGMQVTEYVDVIRDDFNTGTGNIPVGKIIWTLNAQNELDKPDPIWSQAGPKGLGVNPLKRWPAMIDQNQLFCYRTSANDTWHSGPSIIIRTVLSGNINDPKTLQVTTTDNKESRNEPYRGPRIRMMRPNP